MGVATAVYLAYGLVLTAASAVVLRRADIS